MTIKQMILCYNFKLLFGEIEEVRTSPTTLGKDEMNTAFSFLKKHPMASAIHIEYSDNISKCFIFDSISDYENGIITIITTKTNEKDSEKKAFSKAKKEVMDELKAQLANE